MGDSEYGLPWQEWKAVRLIGMGVSGTIYEAVRKLSDSSEFHSAVKTVIFSNRDQKKTDSFINEIAAIKSKNHPNVVKVEDCTAADLNAGRSGQKKKAVYVREELMTPVTEYFKDKTVNEKTIVRMGIDICGALECMELLKLVHNRVIPNNIFVNESFDGEPVFKLSCSTSALQKRSSLNSASAYPYTRFYSAPEIGTSNVLHSSADVYSLGILLYQYLNDDRLPFLPVGQMVRYSDYDHAERIRISNAEEIPDPSNASGDLAKIILKAIAYYPSDRFRSANEFKKALIGYQNSKGRSGKKGEVIFPELPWQNWYIIRRIGRGGFAKVYEAEQKNSIHRIRHSAVKIVHIPNGDDDLDEIRVSAGMAMMTANQYINRIYEAAKEEIVAFETFINHPNIVHLEDSDIRAEYDEEEEINRYTIYMRMELLQTIKGHFKDGRMDEKSVLKMGIDICSALVEMESYLTADGERVFHRDVTPDNILISETIAGRISFKLNDFGIVRKVKSSFTTAMSRRKGKYFFMAPEIASAGEVNPTIDLYSLGMSMYYFLNGNMMPFVEDSNSMAEAEKYRVHGSKPIPAPKLASEQLGNIVLKAISYKPEDRYNSAAEMKKALIQYACSFPDFLSNWFYI